MSESVNFPLWNQLFPEEQAASYWRKMGTYTCTGKLTSGDLPRKSEVK